MCQLEALPVIPDDRSEAYDAIIDWAEEEHSGKLKCALRLQQTLTDSSQRNKVSAVARGLFEKVWAAFTEIMAAEDVTPLLARFFAGDSVAEHGDEVGSLGWHVCALNILWNLMEIGVAEDVPKDHCLLKSTKDLMNIASQAIELVQDTELSAFAKLKKWKSLFDDEKACKASMLEILQRHADHNSESKNIYVLCLRAFREGSIKTPLSAYACDVIAQTSDAKFVAEAEVFQSMLSEPAQLAISRFHTRQKMMEVLTTLNAGGSVGLLQLANVLQRTSDEQTEGIMTEGEKKDLKAVRDKFNGQFKEHMAKVKFEKAAELYDKYACIVPAYKAWDFKGCEGFVYEGHDEKVYKVAQADASVMEVIATTAVSSQRILQGLAEVVAHDKDKSDQVRGALATYSNLQKKIDEVPRILAAMMLCSQLVQPRTQAGKTSLSQLLGYLKNVLHVPRSSLPKELEQKISGYLSGGEASSSSSAPPPPAPPAAADEVVSEPPFKVAKLKKKGGAKAKAAP